MSSLSLAVLPKVEQLSPRVLRILGLNPGKYTLQGTNTYLVGTGEQRILIDTGAPERTDYLQLLKSALQQAKCTISDILLTHWHLDHTGGIHGVRALVTELGGGPVNVSKLPLLPSDYFTANEGGGGGERENSTLQKLGQYLPNDHTHLQDGTQISVEGATLVVIATPGHTPDHISLLLEEENAVFTGDCILGQGSAIFENFSLYMKSLERLRALAPSLLYPGHGPVVNDPVTHIKGYIDHRLMREKQVIEYLSTAGTPCSVADIVTSIYPGLHPELVSGATDNISHHLLKLEHENRISKCNDELWTLN